MIQLESNLTVLGLRDESLCDRIRRASLPEAASVAPARSGLPTLLINGVSMHSRYDPAGEARVWAESVRPAEIRSLGLRPAVFGLGLGHHVLALAPEFDELLVIEPDPGLIRLALSHLDFTEAIPRLVFLIEPEGADVGVPTVLFPYPPSVRLNPGAYAEWASRLGSESSAGNMLRRSETAAELAAAWGETPGLVDLLAPIDPGAGLEAARLARLAETRRGPLTEAEIYILLMDELARVRA